MSDSILSAEYFHNEEAAYPFIEARLWPRWRNLPALRPQSPASLCCRIRFRYNNRKALGVEDSQRAERLLGWCAWQAVNV